jgi:hypothetical protein
MGLEVVGRERGCGVRCSVVVVVSEADANGGQRTFDS